MFNDDADDVYGVNNLSYLQQQLRGYDTESNRDEELTESGTAIVSTVGSSTNDVISIDSSSLNGEDGSGDGAPDGDTEIKADYIPIPNNADPSGTVSTHLQRLSQIIKGLSSDQYQSFELGPDELNEFLALQKIKVELGNSKEIIINPNSRPIPSNGQINSNDFNQIIDLQNKVKKLGAIRDTFSTPPTPSEYVASGNGFYPSGATTFHISATNAMKNPSFPDAGFTTSQIVVNRPEGSVVFSLPPPSAHDSNYEKRKNEPSISEETLKTLLEISKQMQSSNKMSGISPLTTASSPLILPVVQPVFNYPLPILPNFKDGNSYDMRPMQKISSISGNLNEDGDVGQQPEDIGLSTVIHNHIPITISQLGTPSSTRRPTNEESIYDSYGTKLSSESHGQQYYPHLPVNDAPTQLPITTASAEYGYQSAVNSKFGRYPPFTTNQIQANQSPYNHGVIDPQQPLPAFSSDDSRYTEKYYTPTPHLNSNNVNRYVNLEARPYPTIRPSTYDPMGASSVLQPSYSPAPAAISQQYSPSYSDEFDRNGNENSKGESDSENSEYNYSSSDGASGENVMDLLTNYNMATSVMRATKKPIFEFKPSSSENHKQIVNLGGNYMSLETYQSSIEPFIQNAAPQVEVLTCATGVRQANSSDCTRYFVCNAKTGKVLSYSCPPYTAFNPDTKICNTKTFSDCHPMVIRNHVPVNASQKNVQQDAQYSLLEAQRIRAEALKAQHMAHMIKMETQKIIDGHRLRNRPFVPAGAKATRAPSPTPPMRSKKRPLPKPVSTSGKEATKTASRRKIPCRTEGKLADTLSKYNYFICFKDSDGKMLARKMLCPAKLVFCRSTKLCTSTQRCTDKRL